MTFVQQKSKIILIAILAAFSFVLFTQHINADTYSLSGTIEKVNYDSGSITIVPNHANNYTDIKGFSGNKLKAISKQIHNEPTAIYNFKLKNKNQIISYSYNEKASKKNNPMYNLLHAMSIIFGVMILGIIIMIIFSALE